MALILQIKKNEAQRIEMICPKDYQKRSKCSEREDKISL